MNIFALLIISLILISPSIAQQLSSNLVETNIRCIDNDFDGLTGTDLINSFGFCSMNGVECVSCETESTISSVFTGGIKIFGCQIKINELNITYECDENGCMVEVSNSRYFVPTNEQEIMEKCTETFGRCECSEGLCSVPDTIRTLPVFCDEKGCTIGERTIPYCYMAPIQNNASITLNNGVKGAQPNGGSTENREYIKVGDDGRLILSSGTQLLADSEGGFEVTSEKLRFRRMLGEGEFNLEADIISREESNGETFLMLKNIRMFMEGITLRKGVVVDINAKADKLNKGLSLDFSNSDEFHQYGNMTKIAEIKVGNNLADFNDVTITFKVHKSVVQDKKFKIFKILQNGSILELAPKIKEDKNWYYVIVHSNSFSIYAITTIGYANPDQKEEPNKPTGLCLGSIAMIGAIVGVGILRTGKVQQHLL